MGYQINSQGRVRRKEKKIRVGSQNQRPQQPTTISRCQTRLQQVYVSTLAHPHSTHFDQLLPAMIFICLIVTYTSSFRNQPVVSFSSAGEIRAIFN